MKLIKFTNLIFATLLLNNLAYSQNYNYAEALQKTTLLLDIQRDGKVSKGITLPDCTYIANRVNWRGNSYLNDGKAITNDPFAPNGTPDLTGGWFDAGDPPKWSTAIASATTLLAWGLIEYPQGFAKADQTKFVKGNLKWSTDYLLKTFRFDPNNPSDVSKYRIYIVVGGSGGGSGEDKYRGMPLTPAAYTLNEQVYLSCPHEVIENTLFNLSDFPKYQRPIYYADKDAPATSTVAGIAAALASSSVVFRGDGSNSGDVAYANLLLDKAKMLLNYANTYMIKSIVTAWGARSGGTLKNKDGNLINSEFAGGRWDINISGFRPGISYSSSLCWAALWIHEAEIKKNPNYGSSYLTQAIEYTNNAKYPLPPLFEDGSRACMFDQVKDDWGKLGKFNNSKETMCYTLLAKLLGKQTEVHHTQVGGGKGNVKYTYGQLIESLANASLTATITPSGMPEFGPFHLALSGMQAATFLLFVSTDKILGNTHPKYNDYIAFGKKIIDYCLGTNPNNRSYLVGFNPPNKIISLNVLHGPAQGFWDGPKFNWNSSYPASDELGDFSTVKPRHICYGGLTSPSYDGSYNPNGYDSFNHEVGPVYQQGFDGNLARMVEKLGVNAGSPLTDFPKPEISDGKEYYVRIKEISSYSNSLKISALITNHSAWPAVVKNNMSFRYYFTKEAGTTVTATIGTNLGYPTPGVTLSSPKLVNGDLYYVEASFPNLQIYPGGCKEHPDSKLDVTRFPRIPHHEKEIVFTLTSTGAWNNTNDWSYGKGVDVTTRGYGRVVRIGVFDGGKYLAGEIPPDAITGEDNKVESNEGLNVYPNPVKNRLTVNFYNKEEHDWVILQLIDTKGKIIWEKKEQGIAEGSIKEINLEGEISGMYFLKITTSKGVYVKPIIKE